MPLNATAPEQENASSAVDLEATTQVASGSRDKKV